MNLYNYTHSLELVKVPKMSAKDSVQSLQSIIYFWLHRQLAD
jgi:hypothetical protein